jgi:hypothetical protein
LTADFRALLLTDPALPILPAGTPHHGCGEIVLDLEQDTRAGRIGYGAWANAIKGRLPG